MKKTLLICLAASAMVSCSQDEVMEVAQKEAISFKDAFVENATRAIDGTWTTATLEDFQVYGNTKGDVETTIVPIFNNVEVKKNETTWSYADQYTQYWIEGNTYNFAAVKHGTVATLTNGLPATITYDATNQEDLLFDTATATGKASGNAAVAFELNHLLSKAMFTVKNEMANNDANSIYFYRVSNVKITNAYKAGTYYVEASGVNAAGSWVPTTGENSTLEVEFGNVCATNNTAENAEALEIGMASDGASNYQRVLIPAVYNDNLNITCTIETLIKQVDGETVTYAVIDTEEYNKNISHTFTKGCAYNFVIKLGNPGEPIEFTVTKVNDWNPAAGGTEVDLPVVNQ